MLRHIRRVGGQNQYIFSSLGNKIYYDAKLLHCFSPPTWLPCKPSISRFKTITVSFDRLSMIDFMSLIFKNIWSFGSLAQNDTKIRSLYIKIHASNDECWSCLVVVSVTTCVHKTENPGLAFNRFNWCRHDFITLCDWGVLFWYLGILVSEPQNNLQGIRFCSWIHQGITPPYCFHTNRQDGV